MSADQRRNRHGRLLTASELEYDQLYETTVACLEWRKAHSAEEFKLAWQRVKRLGEIINLEVIERMKSKRISKIDFEGARTWAD